jgi:DNA-directed RNA polymerase subunit RPC12/RpoP
MGELLRWGMARYRCRRCSELPPRPLQLRRGGAVVCEHCGGVMERFSMLALFSRLLLGGGLLGLSLAALPEAIDGLAMVATAIPGLSEVVARIDPPPEPERRPLALLQGDLVDRLSEADHSWIPTTEPVPGGGIRYRYRRRPGEPELSVAELRQLIVNPPDHSEERLAIASLLESLQRAGVAVEIAQPRKPGAAGEWDHAMRTIRILPTVVEKGTVDFARVLNHESIHVAQSCAGGGIRARPRPLGLDLAMHPELAEHLRDPMYSGITSEEQALEREAYANQHRLQLGAALVERHCPANFSLG